MRTVSLTQVVILLGRVEELIFARSCHVRSRVDRRGLGQRRPRLDPSAARAKVELGDEHVHAYVLAGVAC